MKFKHISIIIFLFGMSVLIWQTYQNSFVKEKCPRIDRLIQSYKYKKLAKKFNSSSVQAKRLNAISDALRHNKTNYQFETGPLKGIGK